MKKILLMVVGALGFLVLRADKESTVIIGKINPEAYLNDEEYNEKIATKCLEKIKEISAKNGNKRYVWTGYDAQKNECTFLEGTELRDGEANGEVEECSGICATWTTDIGWNNWLFLREKGSFKQDGKKRKCRCHRAPLLTRKIHTRESTNAMKRCPDVCKNYRLLRDPILSIPDFFKDAHLVYANQGGDKWCLCKAPGTYFNKVEKEKIVVVEKPVAK